MRKAPIPVFAGPSLPPAARPADDRFDWRAPAAAGDILALAENPPERLCLIDGFFDWRPAPWHKELLILMARGTAIFGAASMGALRAAELDRHGMIGIGHIYRAYRDGRVTGDDEVALIHAPEELGWKPLSLPLIEIRATLIAALRRRLLAAGAARRLLAIARSIHFTDRDRPTLQAKAGELLGEAEFARLCELHVPLKRIDALACLRAALSSDEHPPAIPPPPHSPYIDALAAEIGAAPVRPEPFRDRRKRAPRPSRATDGGA